MCHVEHTMIGQIFDHFVVSISDKSLFIESKTLFQLANSILLTPVDVKYDNYSTFKDTHKLNVILAFS